MRVNTTNPIVTTIPVDVARANPLARGQLLEVLVVQKLGDARFLLQSGTQRWQTESQLTLQPGEKVQARVLQVEPDQSITLLITRSSEQIASALIREQIPRQQSFAMLASVLRQTADFQLPPDLNDAVLKLVAALPDPGRLMQPAMLGQILQNSGLFLESRLHRGQPVAQDDLKACLLQLAALLPPALAREEKMPLPVTQQAVLPAPLYRLLADVKGVVEQQLSLSPTPDNASNVSTDHVSDERTRQQLQRTLDALEQALLKPPSRTLLMLAGQLLQSGQSAVTIAHELMSRSLPASRMEGEAPVTSDDDSLAVELLERTGPSRPLPAVLARTPPQTLKLHEQLANHPLPMDRSAIDATAMSQRMAPETDPVDHLLTLVMTVGGKQDPSSELSWSRQQAFASLSSQAGPLAHQACHEKLQKSLESLTPQRAGSHGMMGCIEPQGRLPGLQQAVDAQDWMQQLSNAVDSSLSRLTGHQLQHVLDREAAVQQWMIELPVRDRDGIDVLQLHVRREHRRRSEHEPSDPWWQLTLSFDFAGTGPVMVKVMQQREMLMIRFHAERESAWRWIDSQLERFSSRLAQRGLQGVQLDLQRGMPHPDTLPKQPTALLRTQA